MKRIGSSTPLFLPLLLFLLSAAFYGAMAQDTDVTVESTISETKIFIGERIKFSVEISGNFNNVSRPSLPDFDGLRLLSNNPSISRQFNMINGKTSTTYGYSYFLIAQQEGSFEIPAVEVEVDGTIYKTEPIQVSVLKQSGNTGGQSIDKRPEIFIELEISDRSPVTGQQLIADVMLYFKSGLEVNSYQPVPGWKAEGFWKEELENRERPRAESVILDGVRYRKARLMQFSLFPTKAGELTISPFEIIVSVRSTSSRNDPLGSFFSGFGTNQRRVELRTDPISLAVESLPAVRDANYIGAVGQFTITRDLKTEQIYVGESIEIETKITGIGNIPLITKPEYELPDGLEIYEPQENASINRRNSRISGSKSFTDVIIARTPGTYTIPAVNLAYFNPSRNQYLTESLSDITFTVERSPTASSGRGEPVSFQLKPVTGLASWVTTSSTGSLLTYWWFWIGLVLPLIILGVGYWQKTYMEKMNTDREFARAQKAEDLARERLDRVLELSDNDELKNAYNLLHKALTGFIGDRLGLPEAGISDIRYISVLEENNIPREVVKNVRMLLDKCSSISYAPNTSHEYLKSHVSLAQNLIKQLKNHI